MSGTRSCGKAGSPHTIMLRNSRVLGVKLTCSTSTWLDTAMESISMPDCHHYRLPGSERGQLFQPGGTTQLRPGTVASSRSPITKMDQEWRARHWTVIFHMEVCIENWYDSPDKTRVRLWLKPNCLITLNNSSSFNPLNDPSRSARLDTPYCQQA